MDEEPIVAVALLTQHDLDVLGQGFKRSYRVHGTEGFEDLLAQLDRVAAVSASTPSAPAAPRRR